jgi:23S rRNA (guanosine2251-2'-O)-methyltransferase
LKHVICWLLLCKILVSEKSVYPMNNEQTFVFGINAVLEKLKASAGDVSEILIANRSDKRALQSVIAEARRHGLRVTFVHPDLLNRLTGGQSHQGVLAKMEAFTYLTLTELTERLSESTETDWVLILDSLTDPRNFGAVLRTAEAVGARHVVIPKDRSVGVTATVVKASAGAVHHLNIYKATNLRRVIMALKARGFWIVGLHAEAQAGIHDVIYPEKLGIILGSEGKGVRPLILKECDYVVSIPMLGKVASLNVAVAGAVFLYEILRQKVHRKH